MKKVVSMFVALVMIATMGPVMSAKAENACEGENCQVSEADLSGWAWCKENPKDCAAYSAEKVWNGTKWLGSKAWDGTAWARGKVVNDAADAWNAVKNYNYTQLGENMKWCAHNAGDCAASAFSDTKEWLGNRIDEIAAFKGSLEDLYDYDLQNQAKWPFWLMVTTAAKPVVKAVGKVAGGTVKLPFILLMKMFNPCLRAKQVGN